HRPHHQGENGIGVLLDRRDVRSEVLGAERGPDLLHDLAAAILERFLESTRYLVTECVVGCDADNLLVALITGPLPKRVMRLRRRPACADEIGILVELALGEVVGGGY